MHLVFSGSITQIAQKRRESENKNELPKEQKINRCLGVSTRKHWKDLATSKKYYNLIFN